MSFELRAMFNRTINVERSVATKVL